MKGLEDVLILCLNPAPLSTQESVSLQCVIQAGCLVTGLFNCWQFLSCHMFCFLVGPLGFLEGGVLFLNSWAEAGFPVIHLNSLRPFLLILFNVLLLEACRCDNVQ